MIRLRNHIVLSKEFIKKARPEKRRFSEILERSRLQALQVSPLLETAYACLKTEGLSPTPKKVTARKLLIIVYPPKQRAKILNGRKTFRNGVLLEYCGGNIKP